MKNIRKITINDKEYCWSVRSKNVDLVHIGIWSNEIAGQKLNVKLKYDDPWLNYGPIVTRKDPEKIKEAFNTKPIMPKEVSAIIGTAISFGWQPEKKGRELYLIWDRDCEAFKQLNAEEYKSKNTFY